MAQIGSIKIDDKKLQKAMDAKAEGATYTGAGDNMLDFGSAASFIDEDKTAKRVTIKLKNAGEEDITVQLNNIMENVDGAVILKEGTTDDLSVKASPRSYNILREYVEKHATRLRSIKLNVSEVDQLDEPLKYRTETPWRTCVEEERIPSNYQSQDTNNPKMSEVNDIDEWQLCDASTILYNVRAGREVTLTLLFGASIDTNKALFNKANDAQDTVARAYARRNA